MRTLKLMGAFAIATLTLSGCMSRGGDVGDEGRVDADAAESTGDASSAVVLSMVCPIGTFSIAGSAACVPNGSIFDPTSTLACPLGSFTTPDGDIVCQPVSSPLTVGTFVPGAWVQRGLLPVWRPAWVPSYTYLPPRYLWSTR